MVASANNVYQQLVEKMVSDANLPPLAEGNVRLYRGVIDKAAESELAPPLAGAEKEKLQQLIERLGQGGRDMADGKIPVGQKVLTAEEQKYFDENVAKFVQGGTKFYGNDPAIALKYASQSTPGGQVYYLDVPSAQAAEYVQFLAMADGNSIGLPYEIAKNAKVLGRVSRGAGWVAAN